MAFVASASHVAADTESVQPGDWSDPATWSDGVPDGADQVIISHDVVYDVTSSRISGMTINDGATLAFHPDKDVTLETDQNVLVLGRLQMRPRAPINEGWRNSDDGWRPYFIHTLRFVDIDEREFVGGGMDPVASDVGLWVRGEGVLDIAGAQKTGWVRLAGDALAGASAIELDQTPIGWRNDDTIVVVPTEPPSVGARSWNGFEVRRVRLASGSTMHLDAPLSHDHPAVTDPFTGRVFTAEVLNLSRNARIEGTGNGSASFQPSANGRAHINIRSAAPQSVRYAELVLLGPRGPDFERGRDPTDGRMGRYPLHFHHSGDGSRGSLVEGVVVRRSGNRAVVPHASHGITIRDTVAYDVWEEPYWWDPGDSNQTHDVRFERSVAAIVKDDPDFRGYSLAGWQLERGAGTAVVDSVAIGVQGNSNSSGFQWPSSANNAQFNVWEFEGNLAHNNKITGIFVWQNDSSNHIVRDFTAYRNAVRGIQHGAYRNVYEYIGVSLFENGSDALLLQAKPRFRGAERSDGYLLAFEDFRATERLHIGHHVGDGNGPTLFLNCTFQDGVLVNESGTSGEYDFVRCGLEPDDFELVSQLSGSRIRVQRANGTAYQIDDDGNLTTIAAFYDTGDESAEPPTASLTADPTSIEEGQSSTLSWSSTDADSCAGTNFSTGGAASGTQSVSPTVDTTYEIECTGPGGAAQASATVTVTAAPAPSVPTASLTADPTSIEEGQSSTLSWSSTDADSCAGTNFSTGGAASGTQSVSPTADTTYEVECTGPGGAAQASATVTVTASPPPPPPPGGCPNCVASFTLVDAATDQDIGPLTEGSVVDLSAHPQVNIRANTDPRIVDSVVFSGSFNRTESGWPYAACAGSNTYNDCGLDPGSYTVTATPTLDGVRGTPLTVNFTAEAQGPPEPEVPTASLTAAPAEIEEGQSSTLSWSSTDADSCAGTNFSTGGAVSGTQSVSPTADTTYEIECTGPGGAAQASATVTVTASPPPPPPPGGCPNCVVDFTLVDSESDQDIGPLTEGMVIDLAAHPHVNIRANTDPEEVKWVDFEGSFDNFNRRESNWPYAACSGGPYADCHLVPGPYTLTATPKLDSTWGTPLTVNFSAH